MLRVRVGLGLMLRFISFLVSFSPSAVHCAHLYVTCHRRVDRLPIKHLQSGFSNRLGHFQRAPTLQLCNKTGQRRNTKVTSAVGSDVRGLASEFREPGRGQAVRADTLATRVGVNAAFESHLNPRVLNGNTYHTLHRQLGPPRHRCWKLKHFHLGSALE